LAYGGAADEPIGRRFAPRSAFACLFMIWTPSGRFALGGKVG
jgi:hypothetical protein